MDYKSIIFLVLSIVTFGRCSDELNAIGIYTEKFAAEVYKKLSNTSGNLLISPISAQTVLALIQTGANGTTLEEMSKALSLPPDKNQLEESFASLQTSLRNIKYVTLESANKVYLRNDIKLSENFKESAGHFDAEIDNIDVTNAKEAAAIMNNWVENKTNHKIKDLVSEDSINTDTAIILINALYFNAGWQFPFDEKFTSEQDFYVNENKTVKVEMMYDKTLQFYYRNDELDATFLELSYKDPDFALIIVLPNIIDGLSNLENNMVKVLEQHSQSVYEDLVEVWLPKFKIEGFIDLKEILKKLGVHKLFDDAELSGLTEDGRDLQVAEVFQKTFIDVNEKGTEAAAATVAFLEDRISSGPPKFKANHPFVFILRQKSTGIVHFLGRYTGP